MRPGLPSITALVVAGARGLGTIPGHRGLPDGVPTDIDPVVGSLLPWPLNRVLALIEAGASRAPLVSELFRVASLGLVDHLVLRTLAIDHAIDDAVAGGVRQLVILGAGLDARAHRMRGLGDTTVYELDFPSTQAFKRARAEGLSKTARAVEYVSVHFEKERLADALRRSGHDPSRPTVFVWEGVTMYLPRLATESTLQDIAAASASGSRLIMSYATPEKVTAGRLVAPIADLVFGAIGEPIRGLMTTGDCEKMLARAGYSVEHDAGVRQWASELGYTRRALLTIAERVVVARRD